MVTPHSVRLLTRQKDLKLGALKRPFLLESLSQTGDSFVDLFGLVEPEAQPGVVLARVAFRREVDSWEIADVVVVQHVCLEST